MKETILTALKTEPLESEDLKEKIHVKGNKELETKLKNTIAKLKLEGSITKLDNGKWALSVFELCSTCKGNGWVNTSKTKSLASETIPPIDEEITLGGD